MTYTKFAVALFGLCILLSNFANADSFVSAGKKSRNISDFPKWIEVLKRLQDEETLCAKKQDCPLKKWTQFIEQQQANPDKISVINEVNSYINTVKYIKDSDRWGKSDYWATPQEFVEDGGDCEDFAIAKFFMLKKIGFENKDMRIVILNDVYKNEIHSVLVVNVSGESYLLDNEIPKVIKANDIRQYKPIYSINETNWWRYRI